MAGDIPDTTPRGSCHGFEIRSGLAFRSLRSGGGTALYVGERDDLAPEGELVAIWHARPDNPFHGRLLRDGSHYAFWTSDAGWYVIDPVRSAVLVSSGADALRRELRLLGVPTSICTLEQGDVSVHASGVDIAGHGVLFAGPGRYGKTTLAAAFARAGHRLLSEDTSRCSVDPWPRVFPGPAVLRLRPDIARQLPVAGIPAPPAPGENRVPVLIDQAARGDGAAVPLKAIVLLDEGPGPRLAPVTAAEAVRDVLALAFRLPSEGQRAAVFARVTDLIGGVEVLRLQRKLSIESLADVVTLVERHIASSG